MDSEDEERMPYSADDQCAICMSAKATMQTLPCGHRVVCRKCFIKTIQSAIADHALPLKCIVCRASVLKLGSCKKVVQYSSSLTQSSSSAMVATPSKSARRTAASQATRSAGPGTACTERQTTRSSDIGRQPEVSSARLRESSSHRPTHRGCCHHHQIPLRQLNGQQDAVGTGGAKMTKLQPLPIYPARGSAPTQRRAFSSTAVPPAEAAAASFADARDCSTSSAARAGQIGHRAT